MENLEPSKIGLVFLAFLFNFLEIIKSWQKKKGKNNEQFWTKTGPSRPIYRRKRARPRPRCRFCAESPEDLKFAKESLPLFLCLADTCRNTPALSLFTIPSPRRRTTGNRAPVSLYRPIHSMTDVLLWQRLNSSPDESFPSINFTNGALTCSVHGDRVINDHSNVFPMIQGSLAKLNGSVSIRSK
jgi:hypothetical protein